MSRRTALLGLALAAVLAASTRAHADLGAFTIERFDAILEVQDNSDLIVEERIVVAFQEPRRGIYREIPIRYTDPRGYQYGYEFRLLGVEDEHGVARTVKETRNGSLVRIRIGDADRTVRGTQVYTVRYRARNVLRQFGDYDELYWNVTGHQWNTTIASSSVTVRLPGQIDTESINVAAWAGSYGSQSKNTNAGTRGPSEVYVENPRPLDRRQGLTIAIAWPPGHVAFPGILAQVWRFFLWNGILIVPVLALVFLVRRYKSRGRDPEVSSTVVVRYEPPAGVSAGVIGTLFDEKVDMIDITATIVDLAVRGHLTIKAESKDQFFGLKKGDLTVFELNDPPANDQLLVHESLILSGLFTEDPKRVTTEDLKEEFYKKIPGIRSAMYDRLVEKRFMASSPQSVRRKEFGMGVFIAILTALAGILMTTAQGGVLPNAAIIPGFAAAVTLALFAGFAPSMPRRTREGVRALMWARGFQEFAGRVEEDRFEREAARQTYETLLPYAMALNVATKWSKSFEGIYDENPPTWYVGPNDHRGSLSTTSFHRYLSDSMTDVGRSLATSPRSSGSSGSGGGGFSGGGGGGGGGGSW